MKRALPFALALLALPGSVHAAPGTSEADAAPSFRSTVRKVVMMPNNRQLQRKAWYRHKLNVLNVMWEDTGRSLGSSGGPNISDLTLQVHEKTKRGTRRHLLPVIRHPNFTDKTADVPAEEMWVKVGNQHEGGKPVAVPLTEVLANLKEYISEPDKLRGTGDFLAKRDTHFLVSAQHAFVPLPPEGKVEFNPVLFNYQSYAGSPAVMTLLITREGMSATVIDSRGGDWGQPLYFNNAGQKALFTAERRSAVEARVQAEREVAGDEGALEEGTDMMMIVQVPLRQRQRPRRKSTYMAPSMPSMAPMKKSAKASGGPAEASRSSARAVSDVERAVIGHGSDKGPFREMRGLRLRRDTRFPVRVTVQFYKATSNGVVSDQDLANAAEQIDRVYAQGDYVGSLVVPRGDRNRPTAWVNYTPPLQALAY